MPDQPETLRPLRWIVRGARRVPLVGHVESLAGRCLEPARQWAKRRALAELERGGPGSTFTCKVNDQVWQAPYEMLRLWPHCWRYDPRHRFNYSVEHPQSRWLCERLRPGDCALDIGAAFGVITLPMSRVVGPSGVVHAFEPALSTKKHLAHTLDLNQASNVVIADLAVSDCIGEAKFIEYSTDNELAWASDASGLAGKTGAYLPSHEECVVTTTTIDDYVEANSLRPTAIKMDIEGAELYALRGGAATLAEFGPALCIDLHLDLRTGEHAEPGVREFLVELGYRMRTEQYTLYADRAAD